MYYFNRLIDKVYLGWIANILKVISIIDCTISASSCLDSFHQLALKSMKRDLYTVPCKTRIYDICIQGVPEKVKKVITLFDTKIATK